MSQMMMSRRHTLIGTAAIAGMGMLGGFPLATAEAKAPMRDAQAPYFYRLRHGQMQVTVASDGPLALGDPSGAFLGVSKQEIGEMLSRNFLAPGHHRSRTECDGAQYRQQARAVRQRHGRKHDVWQDNRPIAQELARRWHRSPQYRRGRDLARPHRSPRRHRRSEGQSSLPQRTGLYQPGGFRFLDRREQTGGAEGFHRACAQELAALSRSHRFHQGRRGISRRVSKPWRRPATPSGIWSS